MAQSRAHLLHSLREAHDATTHQFSFAMEYSDLLKEEEAEEGEGDEQRRERLRAEDKTTIHSLLQDIWQTMVNTLQRVHVRSKEKPIEQERSEASGLG